MVSLAPSQLKSCILLGDFNVNLLSTNQLSSDLVAMLSSHFTQVISEPTRVSKKSTTLIDHVYLTDPSLLSSCSTCPPLGNSDHRSILLSLTWSKCPPQKIRRLIWNYSRADWNTICDELDDLPSSSDDIDSSWAAWKSHFLPILSHHIPSRVCKVRKSLPWITPDLLKLFRKCD